MKQKRLCKSACALIAIGILAAIISMGILWSVPDTLQYAVAAPGGEDGLSRALDIKKNAEEALGDCVSAVAIGAVTEKSSVSTGNTIDSATVYAVGEGWFEVYPVFMEEGRRLMESELHHGDCVALLDADLAFALFNSELPPDAKVSIGETEYHIVGTVRHHRNVGESQEHCVYVPLTSAPKANRDVLIVAAKPIANSGAQTIFESTMQTSWQGNGCFYSISKEVLRQMMLPRTLLLLFGLSAGFALLRKMNRISSRRIANYREKLSRYYFKDTLSTLAATILTCLLGYAAILTLLSGLVIFSLQPLTVFTEWVPENFVKWTSLKNVFWNLSDNAAKLIKVGTRELRLVQFWGNILRWSMIGILAGGVLWRRTK